MPLMSFGRNSRLAAVLVAAVLGLGLAASASADTPPGRGSTASPIPPGPCAVLQVHLNGTQPATHACLVEMPDAQRTGPSTQATPSTSCGTGVLQLFVDTNYGGATLCVSGHGIMNLDYYTYYTWYGPIHWPHSWTDALSSFRTGIYYVNFYEHKDFGGEKLRYASYQSRASMPSGWNDRVSSICIWNDTYTCP